MKHWKIGHLDDWLEYEKKQELKFLANGRQRVKMKVMCDTSFQVYAESATLDGEIHKTLVAVGASEIISLDFECDGNCMVTINGGGKIFYNAPDIDQTTEAMYPDQNFVNLEPKETRDPDIVRYQNMVNMRIRALDAEIAKAKASGEKQVQAPKLPEPEIKPVAPESEVIDDTDAPAAA